MALGRPFKFLSGTLISFHIYMHTFSECRHYMASTIYVVYSTIRSCVSYIYIYVYKYTGVYAYVHMNIHAYICLGRNLLFEHSCSVSRPRISYIHGSRIL